MMKTIDIIKDLFDRDYCRKCGRIKPRIIREEKRSEQNKYEPGTVGYYNSLTKAWPRTCECK